MEKVQELGPEQFLIDHRFLGKEGLIASYLVASGDALAVVEAGPASTWETVWSGIEDAGYDPRSVTHLFLTHIHLDHAGGTGTLLERMPHATAYVHPRGARHLLDPSRLLASAERIYGAEMDRLWGDTRPVPADRLVVLEDEEAVRVGARTLGAIATPGHASHHHAYHDPDSGTVYTGDVAGVRLAGAPYVRPPTPPPDIDLDAWRSSLARLRALRPQRLCLTHYGAVEDVEWHLDDLLSRLYFWAGWLEAQSEIDADELTRRLAAREDPIILARTGSPEVVQEYEYAVAYRMSVDGLLRALSLGR